MNTAEKIAVLEALLARVQKRAQQPRPTRASLTSSPVSAEVPVVAPVEATPSVSAAPELHRSSDENEIEIEMDIAPPSPPSQTREEPATLQAVHGAVSAPVPLTKSASGSYAAKGGMAEELPDLDLELEEEDEGREGEEFARSEEGNALAPSAAAPSVANAAGQANESEAEEFELPSRSSVPLRAVAVPPSIEISRNDEALELDHRPLASTLPTSAEEPNEQRAQPVPLSSASAVAKQSEASVEVHPAPPFKTPEKTEFDDRTPTLDAPVPLQPEPPAEEPIPLVATSKPSELASAVRTEETLPANATAVPPAHASTTGPHVAVKEPIVHEPVALSASEPVVRLVSELPAPAAPLSFVGLLRRSLALRVKSV